MIETGGSGMIESVRELDDGKVPTNWAPCARVGSSLIVKFEPQDLAD